MFNLKRLLVAALAMRLPSIPVHVPSKPEKRKKARTGAPIKLGKSPPPERTRIRVRMVGFLPHCNARECARRVGGKVWLDYRNARRASRGLPALES